MRILIACEMSGVVREAFRAKGHDAWSCDILPSEMDVLSTIGAGIWDMMIAFPPCTDLCVSGARWFADKQADGRQTAAIDFFMAMVNAPIPRIAIENPIGIMSLLYRKPTQIIQPWQFGHGETKATCLWLKGLPKLNHTKIVQGREGRIWKMAPSPERAKERSRTFAGIAQAMADQWG